MLPRTALTICARRSHPKSHSGLSYAVIAVFSASFACGAPGPTQPTVVVHASLAACDEIPPGQDPYEGALARARCEHPDMLVHPRAWLVRRVPSPPMVARFALDRAETHVTECVYEVDRAGRVRRVR